jgi:uncharacterized protein (DUF983 family)
MKQIIALTVAVVGTLIVGYIFFLPPHYPPPYVYVIIFLLIFTVVYCLIRWVSTRKGKKT